MDLAANSQANANTESTERTSEPMSLTEMQLVAILYVARNAAHGVAEDSANNAFRIRFHLEALISALKKGNELPRLRA